MASDYGHSIHCRTDRLGEKLGIKIVFPYQHTMFAGILLKTIDVGREVGMVQFITCKPSSNIRQNFTNHFKSL